MKNALKSITAPRNASSARVVDGKLILSFPHAQTPVVWQMDLDQTKASALEVREKKSEGLHVLTLKTAKGETMEIAPFARREDAVSGLMAVSRALENAQGRIRPATNSGTQDNASTAPAQKSSGKWMPVVLGALLILVLLGIWGSLLPRAPGSLQSIGADTAANTGQNEAGVPLSADAFLKGR